jgi:hypothetical protein
MQYIDIVIALNERLKGSGEASSHPEKLYFLWPVFGLPGSGLSMIHFLN